MRHCSVIFSLMIRLLGISLGLIGTTVLGGMGLSYAHDAIYLAPTPVRADVVAPAPVLSRAAPVLTRDAPVLRKAPETVFEVPTVEVVRLAPDIAAVRTDAVATVAAEPDSVLEAPGSALAVVDTGPAPLISARPKMRTFKKTQRTAAVFVPRKARPAAPRALPQVTRSVRSEPLRRAVPKQTPKFLIGVYR